MRFLVRSLSGLFLAALTLGLLALSAAFVISALEESNADSGPMRPAEERSFVARVLQLTPGSVQPTLTAFGQVRSRRHMELRSNADGQIVELAPEWADGAMVREGQLLVRVDQADAQSALDLARTDLREAEAEVGDAARAVDLAKADLAAATEQEKLREQALVRQRGLADRGLGTATDMETAELAKSNASQAVLSRRQALAQAEERQHRGDGALSRQRLAVEDAARRLAETEMRAGFGGVLSGVTGVVGGLVNKSEKLGDLIDPDALEVAFRVSTAQYSRLIDASGKLLPLDVTVSLEVFGTDLSARGKLARVDAAVGEGLSGRLVFATLEHAPSFRPGDFVTLAIAEPALDGVARVPARAVGSDGTVLAVTGESRLEAVPVEVLRQQGDEAIIRVGDLAGRDVVAERTALLGAGILVKPVRDGGNATAQEEALIDLTPERRAALIDFVQGNDGMPADAKARVLAQLRAGRVPAEVVDRIESRMGG